MKIQREPINKQPDPSKGGGVVPPWLGQPCPLPKPPKKEQGA